MNDFALSLGPIDPKEPCRPRHLILAVNGDCIVNRSDGQAVLPGGSRIVEIRAGVACNVHAAPPQIEVQLVRLAGAIMVVRRSDHSPALWPWQHIVTADRKMRPSRGRRWRVGA